MLAYQQSNFNPSHPNHHSFDPNNSNVTNNINNNNINAIDSSFGIYNNMHHGNAINTINNPMGAGYMHSNMVPPIANAPIPMPIHIPIPQQMNYISSNYYNMLQPVQMQLPVSLPVPIQAPAVAAAPAAAAVPAQPNGGVSLVLDYDLDQMVNFLSWVTFGLLKKNSNPSLSFIKSLNSVLSATRLPKSTLLLSINYLSNRIDSGFSINHDNSTNNINNNNNADDEIFKSLIISLILANKFNDDKTFKNKSWSDATNLSLFEINKLEREWLFDFDYELSNTDSYLMVENCWNTWTSKNIHSLESSTSNDNLSDLNHRCSSIHSSPIVSSNSFSTDDNFIPNQIFENPFQNNLNHNNYNQFNNVMSSPIADSCYMNDYYDSNTCLNPNPNNLQYDQYQQHLLSNDYNRPFGNNYYNYSADYSNNQPYYGNYSYCTASAC